MENDFAFLSKEERFEWLRLLNSEKELKQCRTKGKPSEAEVNVIRQLRTDKKNFIDSLEEGKATRLLERKVETNKSEFLSSSSKKTSTLSGDEEEEELRIISSLAIRDERNEICELVDIGMNLHDKQSYEEMIKHLKRAYSVGVRRIILTGSTLSNATKAKEFCHKYYHRDDINGSSGLGFEDVGVRVYFTVGIHPHEADQGVIKSNDGAGFVLNDEVFKAINLLAESPFCVSLGECGLDYDRLLASREVQLMVFDKQVENARKLKMPLFVHLRELDSIANAEVVDLTSKSGAVSDLISVFKKYQSSGSDVANVECETLFEKLCVHCFTGNRAVLDRLTEFKVSIGITGYIGMQVRAEASGTFDALRNGNVLPHQVLIETDSPYMRPDKKYFSTEVFKVLKRNKGGHNEPCTLPVTCSVLSEVYNANQRSGVNQLTASTLAKITTNNAINFFKLHEVDKRIAQWRELQQTFE